MKNLFIISWLLIIVSNSCVSDSFKDLLLVQESPINNIYYQLLPDIDQKNPDLEFIRSRELSSFSLDEQFIEMVESAFNAHAIVETGTYLGDTANTMAKHFACVHTIELDNALYEKAKKRFAKNKNINLYQGDSATILPSLMKTLKNKTVFFLDAHFNLGITAQGNVNTPIISEIKTIMHAMKNAILLIDDTRMFYKPIANMEKTFVEGYPTLNHVVDIILSIDPHYKFALIYDVLIAFPAHEKITVSPLIRALTLSRFYDGSNYAIMDVLEAELYIARTQEKEKDIIMDLSRWVEVWSEAPGLSRHNSLWCGLVLLANENYENALKYLTETKKRGLHDWRIDWYIAMAQAQIFFGIR